MQLPEIKLPRWLSGAESSEIAGLASRWWQYTAENLTAALWQKDALTCSEDALDLLAWERSITRFPEEPIELFRKRVHYAAANARDAGSVEGLHKIFARLDLGVIEIHPRVAGMDWDQVLLRMSDKELAQSQLLVFIVKTYGLSGRRYYFEVIDSADLLLTAYEAGCEYRCFATASVYAEPPPYVPEPEPLDADALALFAEMEGALSAGRKRAVSNYIAKLKDPARWDEARGALWLGTHSFCCPQGVNASQVDRRIDWRHPSLSATYSVPANEAGLSAEYGLDRSQIASAPSSEPVFGLPPVNDFDGPYKQNDCAVSMYFTKGENTAGKTGVVLSCSLVNNGMTLIFTTGSTYRMYGFVQSNNNNTLGPNTGGNLPIGGDEVSVSRSGATACRIIQNGVAGAASTTASSATPPGIIAPLMHRPGPTSWNLGTANMAAGRIYVGRHITAAENAMLRQIHNEYLAEIAALEE